MSSIKRRRHSTHVETTKTWTAEETEKFLNCYETLVDNKSYAHRKSLFEDLADRLHDLKCEVTPTQCSNKWKGMLRSYRMGTRPCYDSRVRRLISQLPAEHCQDETAASLKDFEQYRILLKEHDYIPAKEYIKTTWSRFDANRLIFHYKDIYESDEIPLSKKELWERISFRLETEKIFASARQCENKWKVLLKSHRKNLRMLIKGTDSVFERLKAALATSDSVLTRYGISSPYVKILESSQYDDGDSSSDDYDEPMLLVNPESITTENLLTTIKLEVPEPEPELEPEPEPEEQETLNLVVEDSDSDVVEENSFEKSLIKYLNRKEDARQRRHDDNLAIKKRKLDLIEKYLSMNKKIN